MSQTDSKSSYSFYIEDSKMELIDELEGYNQSEVAREALDDWVEKNIGNI